MLDASALVAYARDEPGARIVAAHLRSSGRVLVSAVNWAEAAGNLREYRMTPAILRQALAAVENEIVAFAEADADVVRNGRACGVHSIASRAGWAIARVGAREVIRMTNRK